MGKDYSATDYRKTYDEGYLKSYPQFRILREKWQEYDNIRKKVDTRYSKKEKGKSHDSGYSSYNTTAYDAAAEVFSESVTDAKSPPSYQKEKKYSVDYSYINQNSLKHPVLSAGNGLYKNVYTEELINEKEARAILEYAGYKPQLPRINLLLYIFICVPAFFLRVIGPLLFVIYGAGLKLKSVVTYRKMVSGYILEFQMPATESHKDVFKRRGNIYIYTGFIIAIAQMVFLFKVFGGL